MLHYILRICYVIYVKYDVIYTAFCIYYSYTVYIHKIYTIYTALKQYIWCICCYATHVLPNIQQNILHFMLYIYCRCAAYYNILQLYYIYVVYMQHTNLYYIIYYKNILLHIPHNILHIRLLHIHLLYSKYMHQICSSICI